VPTFLQERRHGLGEAKYKKFVQEMRKLEDPASAAQSHGFNLGCLATTGHLEELVSIKSHVWKEEQLMDSDDDEPYVESAQRCSRSFSVPRHLISGDKAKEYGDISMCIIGIKSKSSSYLTSSTSQ